MINSLLHQFTYPGEDVTTVYLPHTGVVLSARLKPFLCWRWFCLFVLTRNPSSALDPFLTSSAWLTHDSKEPKPPLCQPVRDSPTLPLFPGVPPTPQRPPPQPGDRSRAPRGCCGQGLRSVPPHRPSRRPRPARPGGPSPPPSLLPAAPPPPRPPPSRRAEPGHGEPALLRQPLR